MIFLNLTVEIRRKLGNSFCQILGDLGSILDAGERLFGTMLVIKPKLAFFVFFA